jgi:hypothetical protein
MSGSNTPVGTSSTVNRLRTLQAIWLHPLRSLRALPGTQSGVSCWGVTDTTEYVFDDLSTDDPDYAGFDDVRSVLIAHAAFEEFGISRWLGATLSSPRIVDKSLLRQVAEKGLTELWDLLFSMGVE